MSFFDSVRAISLARSEQFAGKSWWSDYVTAYQGGASSLAAWMGTVTRYTDFDPTGGSPDSTFVSNRLTTLQDLASGPDTLDRIAAVAAVGGRIGAIAAVVGGAYVAGAAAFGEGAVAAEGATTAAEISTTEAVYTGGEVAASGIDFGAEGVGWSATSATGATETLAATSPLLTSGGVAAGSNLLNTALNYGQRIVTQQLPSLLQRIGIGGNRTTPQRAFLPQQNAVGEFGLGGQIYGANDSGAATGFNPLWIVAAVFAVIAFFLFGLTLTRR